MSITVIEEKKALRERIRVLERSLDDGLRQRSDRALTERFLALEQTQECCTVLVYASVPGEPDTRQMTKELLRGGKRVLLPRCLPGGKMEIREYIPGHLERHPYGMWEPNISCPKAEPEEIGLALIPGICYDKRLYRLGRGAGFYDRWLVGFRGCTVGLCREQLLQETLPAEPHDLPVDILITENRVLYRSAAEQP